MTCSKSLKRKKMHCSQAEDSQPLNSSAMLPMSHAAPPPAWTVTRDTEVMY